jgi:asparagine N-glycosylation enzyme membrane subunit Stt3
MSVPKQSPAADKAVDVPDPVDEAALERVLKTVPQGAFALAGAALGLLMLAWLAVYFLVFLQRGPIN